MENADEILTNLVSVIAKSMVDNPDQVKVSCLRGQQTTVIELVVGKSDLGKIIGKSGKNAYAIRTLLVGASTKLKMRTVLEIVE